MAGRRTMRFAVLTASYKPAEHLKASGVTLVGIDSYNIDDTSDRTRPVHLILLGAEIPIVEHTCNLKKLPDNAFTFYAVPAKIKGFGTFPVRAFGGWQPSFVGCGDRRKPHLHDQNVQINIRALSL
jgi:kynurenine formamidase